MTWAVGSASFHRGVSQRSMTARVPGWSKAEIEANRKLDHDICPYSNLIRFAHEVELRAEA